MFIQKQTINSNVECIKLNEGKMQKHIFVVRKKVIRIHFNDKIFNKFQALEK